jgi:hypothetical protein
MFRARIAIDCQVDASAAPSLEGLRKALVDGVRASSSEIHAESAGADRFEVTRASVDDGDELRVREQVLLVGDRSRSLSFETRSREVRGEGLSAYLRALDYTADFTLGAGGAVSVVLSSRLEIERPWFALAPLFLPIARAKTRAKFVERALATMPVYVSALGASR